MFNSYIKSVLLHGCETWRVTSEINNKLQCFVTTCVRRILNISWPDVVTNQQLWTRTDQIPISQEILKRKWNWIGHTLRKQNSIEREALEWNPQGQRKRGRRKRSLRRSVHEEINGINKTWGEIKQLHVNRVRWSCLVDAICFNGN